MKKTIKWLPIIVVEMYLLFTVILYIFGPWKFETINPLKTYTLLIMYQLALFLGYFISMNGTHTLKAKSYNNRKSVMKIVRIISVINVIMSFIVITRALGLADFSFLEIFRRFIMGLHNPSAVYQMKFGLTVDTIFMGKIGTLLIVLWSPLSYSTIPLNCLFFKDFSFRWKMIAIINIALSIICYIAIGTNKGIFDIAIFIITAFLVNWIRKVNTSINKANIFKFVFIFLLILIPALMLFNKSIGSRGVGSVWKEPWYAIGGMVYINSNSFFIKYLPNGICTFIVLLSSYLCQGYYGFSMATAVKWTPMFGFGNSMFLVNQFSDIIPTFNTLTYQNKVQSQFGWDAREQWHSVYSWLANDFGLYGVIIIMFIIGFLFAILYKESIIYDNPISELLLCFFMIVFFYIPANNQIVQGLESFSSFYFAIIVWFLCRNFSFKIKLKA